MDGGLGVVISRARGGSRGFGVRPEARMGLQARGGNAASKRAWLSRKFKGLQNKGARAELAALARQGQMLGEAKGSIWRQRVGAWWNQG